MAKKLRHSIEILDYVAKHLVEKMSDSIVFVGQYSMSHILRTPLDTNVMTLVVSNGIRYTSFKEYVKDVCIDLCNRGVIDSYLITPRATANNPGEVTATSGDSKVFHIRVYVADTSYGVATLHTRIGFINVYDNNRVLSEAIPDLLNYTIYVPEHVYSIYRIMQTANYDLSVIVEYLTRLHGFNLYWASSERWSENLMSMQSLRKWLDVSNSSVIEDETIAMPSFELVSELIIKVIGEVFDKYNELC